LRPASPPGAPERDAQVASPDSSAAARFQAKMTKRVCLPTSICLFRRGTGNERPR